ncbi:MAG: hypothetical protein ACYCXR_09670 [Coriobacteriia bacterium]
MGAWTHTRTNAVAVLTALCIVAVLLFAAATVAPDTAWSATGTVQITATVRSAMDVTFEADHLIVKANTPWQVSAITPDGEQWTVSGGPTGGYEVVLPEGATGVQVSAR